MATLNRGEKGIYQLDTIKSSIFFPEWSIFPIKKYLKNKQIKSEKVLSKKGSKYKIFLKFTSKT